MIRCRKCGRQLKSAESKLRGLGKRCAGESSHTPLPRAKRPGTDGQPGLFDELVTTEDDEPMNHGDVVDFDELRSLSNNSLTPTD